MYRTITKSKSKHSIRKIKTYILMYSYEHIDTLN